MFAQPHNIRDSLKQVPKFQSSQVPGTSSSEFQVPGTSSSDIPK